MPTTLYRISSYGSDIALCMELLNMELLLQHQSTWAMCMLLGLPRDLQHTFCC